MIHLTRRNKSTLVVNLGSIQYVEATPDTAIVFNNGERIWVVETVEEVVARALAYQRAVFREGVFVLPRGADADEARE